jgi:hypothetical protein
MTGTNFSDGKSALKSPALAAGERVARRRSACLGRGMPTWLAAQARRRRKLSRRGEPRRFRTAVRSILGLFAADQSA